MEPDDIAAAARAAGLARVLAAFPHEVVAAVALAQTQRATLATLPLGPDDAP